MKKRVSALIEKDLFNHAKQRAAQEGRSMGALIQDALISYLSKRWTDPRTREPENPRKSLSTLLREADAPQQGAVQ